jgi:glycosyltransferase involved in cell wall biosynthesis
MKVILLAPTPPPAGGIAGWTVRMQNATLKNDWKVEVVDEKVIGNREVFGSRTKKSIFHEVKRSYNIWKNLFVLLMGKEVKVVHSCIPASTLGLCREYICALISKLWRKKFIIHYRCTLPNMVTSKIGLFMFRNLTNISNLVIVLNNDSLLFVKKNSKTEVELIPNFIELSAIAKNEILISEKITKILYVGGVIESKGCNEIINVAKRFPDIEFRLVGNVQNEIKMSNQDNVILVGEKSKVEVKKELDAADVFIFVTYYPGEGFSNALAEAMANGLPCIATDWAANRDMLEDRGGIIVPIKNINAIAEAINKMQDKTLRKEQSEWNIKKITEKYREDIITGMYVDAYEKVLKNKK